LCKI
jgi:hypothetical protein